jgi:hypothetical protein
MKFITVTRLAALAALILFSAAAPRAEAAGATRVADAIWSDGHLYGTIATPTGFTAPPEQTTDTIYAFFMSGVQGQRSVSEAHPGDTDYNGGRWSVQLVSYTPTGINALTDGYGNAVIELTSDTEVLEHEALGHLELIPTTIYFECPLLP